MQVRFLSRLLYTFLLLAGVGEIAAAQAGAATEILTGRVVGAAGEPLANAVVSATALATDIRRSTLTNAQGRYTLIFPEGTGSYELQVSQIGMRPERVLVVRRAAEEVLVTNVRLEVSPVVLQEITVLGEGERAAPGARERFIEGDWLTLLPIDPQDLIAIASLDPGVVGLEATDSIGSGGFSIVGQRPDLNQISVDGATFGSPRGTHGGLGIPAEAVRLTQVITNSFDVSRGQFSGGQISASTRGGSNRPQGTLTYSLHEPRLQWHADGSPFSRAYTQHRVSGGYGGPLVRGRVFYFGSAAAQHRVQGLRSLMEADAAGLRQLGAHPDSVKRFLDILRQHELSPREPVAARQQLIEELSLFGRLDFVLSERHSLMVRGDSRWQLREGTQVSSLGLPHSGGNNRQSGGGGMVALTSRFGEAVVNEFRAYLSRQDSDAIPYFPVPEGRVRVASDLEDGSRSVSNLIFGGNRSLPVTSTERSLEMSNEISSLLGSRHRVKLGGLLHVTRSAQEFSPTKYGAYSFDSLEDFANNQATAYTRSLTTASREGGGLNAAVYAGNTWQSTHRMQFTLGLRLEGSHFGRQPPYNAEVDSVFGRHTDRFASELHVSPRLGFSYVVGESQRGRRPLATVRGGFGEFRGRPPFSLYSSALNATGLPDGQLQIACVGSSVPLPAWARYRSNPAHIPLACADGEATLQSSGSAPNVTVFTPGFSAPRSWRASLGVERALNQHVTLTVEGIYNRGTHLYGVTDLNLDVTPRFRVASEADRPVFVRPQDIVASSGQMALTSSRLNREFGKVLEVHSNLRSAATQLLLGIRADLSSRLSLNTSYALSRARDQSSFSCCSALQGFGSASTGGDPNIPEWGTSSYERRHAITTTLGLPIRPWMQLTLIGRTTSGTPYTPLVGSDLNGDGVRNDRAFIFNPATVENTEIATGMQRLLNDASRRTRACLERQLGRLAERNSCRGPWHTTLELRANLNPLLPRLERRLTASIASQNLLTGVDQVVNGTAALRRGWGQQSSPDATLLYVRGFDPETHSFEYELNERFGDPRQGQITFGSPFQLHLEARLALGPRRARSSD